jgi:hypothetical protein
VGVWAAMWERAVAAGYSEGFCTETMLEVALSRLTDYASTGKAAEYIGILHSRVQHQAAAKLAALSAATLPSTDDESFRWDEVFRRRGSK